MAHSGGSRRCSDASAIRGEPDARLARQIPPPLIREVKPPFTGQRNVRLCGRGRHIGTTWTASHLRPIAGRWSPAGGRADLVDAGLLPQRAKVSSPAAVRSWSPVCGIAGKETVMSKLRVRAFSVSLDGYGAGPDQSLENPLAANGMSLHQWAFKA